MPDAKNRLLQEALAGRLPVLPDERIYRSYGSLLWTTAVLSAASWAYLIGSALPAFGNTWLAIIGYLVGLIIGEVVVVFAVGIPCFRYGVDPIDVGKAALGSRGSVVLLISILAASLGWAYVLVAMTARGIGRLAQLAHGPSQTQAVSEPLVVVVAISLLVLVWVLTRRGPAAIEHLSRICAPGQIIVAFTILLLMLAKFGPPAVSGRAMLAAPAITDDPLAQIAYAAEFGFDNALGVLPFLGGLTRLVRFKRHLLGPTVIGSGIVGASLVASVAALAASFASTTDPTTWMLQLMGPGIGSAMIGFLLIANIGTLAVLVYVASIAVQQVRAVAGVRFDWIVALTLVPGVVCAFRTEWLLAHVMTWLAYNGVMFVGLAAVMFADYYAVKRQRLRVADLFATPRQGAYWFRGGVNWVAIAVLSGAGAMYLTLFDPISLKVHPLFRYAGAGIPTVVIAALVYLISMRLLGRTVSTRSKAPADGDPIKVTM
jgi:NCS1 family nucleobase:cation symporter-1